MATIDAQRGKSVRFREISKADAALQLFLQEIEGGGGSADRLRCVMRQYLTYSTRTYRVLYLLVHVHVPGSGTV